jgi:TRAP transporter TAXI family solute receptor
MNHRRLPVSLPVLAALLAAGITLSGGLRAADIELPRDVSWTAFGTTSSGYAQSVGIGQMLKNSYEVDLRIIPGENDVARMIPLKTGQSDLCACGIAAYFAQEGVLMFAEKTWGPQRLYSLFNNVGTNGQTAAVAGDIGVKSIADLRGKRVTWLKGSPANNTNMTAFLAFGGLSWDDVEKVEVPGWKQSLDAVLNGQADAVWASTLSGPLNQIAASPRGLYFPPMPHGDKADWARAREIAPWFAPVKVMNLIEGSQNEGPYEGMNYPYPLFVATPRVSDQVAYGLTAAIMENYEDIKDSGPSMDGYQLDRQLLSYVFPYHEAAVAYFKEKGLWTEADQHHNDELLRRQDVLADAWQDFAAKDVAEEDFAEAWMKARAAALTAAKLPVIFN